MFLSFSGCARGACVLYENCRDELGDVSDGLPELRDDVSAMAEEEFARGVEQFGSDENGDDKTAGRVPKTTRQGTTQSHHTA